MTSDRFQRPQTAAGAHAVSASELPPHPPDVRDEEVAEILATDFPIALRGYDRAAVDHYHQRVSRVIAELQAGRSPQSAVRYALEQVSEETRAILQQAHDTADSITTKSRRESSERMETAERESAQMLADAERDAAQMRAEAEREAAELRAAAERRVREAEDDVAAIWQERERLIEDAREIASRLAEVADAAAEREPPAPVATSFADTDSLPSPPVWDDEVEDEDGPPAPALRAVPPPPPPPAEAAPEPSLAHAPPPLPDDEDDFGPGDEDDFGPGDDDDFGPVAFELQEDDAELGPMDEPAAHAAIDEAAVPAGDTAAFTPAWDDDADEDDTAEHPR